MANIPETTLTLRSAIWNRELRASILNKVLKDVEVEVEDRLKTNIDNSTPAGRMYARGVVTARRTASNKHLRSAPGRTTRVIVAARYFRASAVGQPPARRFNVLYNSLKARRVVGKLQVLASANAPGASVLDDPTKLNRPYFRSVLERYRRDEFLDKVKLGVRELLGNAGSS